MSAFMVGKNTIDHVLTAYDELTRDNGRQIQDIEQFDHMGNDLWAMNAQAIAARYGRQAEPEKYEYRRRPAVSRCQMYKSIQCLIYQCSEGDVPETNPLYKWLEDIGQKLASKIVTSLPEYQYAKWDEPTPSDNAISLSDLIGPNADRVAAGLNR